MRDDREFWLQIRRGLLMVVGAIESRWGFPRTGGSQPPTTLGQQPATSIEVSTSPSTEPPR